MTSLAGVLLALAAAQEDGWPPLASPAPSLRAAWTWGALAAILLVALVVVALVRRQGSWGRHDAGAPRGSPIEVVARRRLTPGCELALIEVAGTAARERLLVSLSASGVEVLRTMAPAVGAGGRPNLEALP